MSKEDEKRYYGRLGEPGQRHADGKPFTDAGCGRLLIEFGQILTFLPSPPARILDLGCGTGWTSNFLARVGYAVTGLDISADMIRAAAHLHPHPALTFVVGDFENIPTTSSFNAVVSYGALHHCQSLSSALSGCKRALKEDGLLILMEPGKGHAESETSVKYTSEYGLTERSLPPQLITSTLHKLGYREVQTIPWLSLFSPSMINGFNDRSWKHRLAALITGRRMADVLQWILSSRKTAMVLARR